MPAIVPESMVINYMQKRTTLLNRLSYLEPMPQADVQRVASYAYWLYLMYEIVYTYVEYI